MSNLAIHGGPRVRTRPFPVWPQDGDEALAAVARVVRGGQWGGYPEPGPVSAEFVARFAAYQGSAYGVLLCNGTVTLEVALKALGIGWGDEVVVPAVTYEGAAYAVMAAGALPVFVDVCPNTLTIDPDRLGEAVTPKTAAVIPIHLGHQMADMDRVMEVARRHSLAVVEDCAHAPGQRWRDRGAGSFGAFGSFSHQTSKTLTCGEGGTLLTDDERLVQRARSLIDCGRPKGLAGEQVLGGNYRLGEVQAALLVPGLERLPREQAERATNARAFQACVSGVPGVRVVPPDPRITRWNFWRYVVQVEPAAYRAATNETICRALVAEGIDCWTGFPAISQSRLFAPSTSRLPVAVEHADRLDPRTMHFPAAERAAARTIYLNESVFRDGADGVNDAVEALAKVQRYAGELAEV